METITTTINALLDELMEINGHEIEEAFNRSEAGKISVGFSVTVKRGADGIEVGAKIRAVKDKIDNSVAKTISQTAHLPLTYRKAGE